MSSEISTVIKRYTLSDDVEYDAKRRKIGRMKCPVCGKWIRSTDDLSDVGFVITKRKTAEVFHNKCYPKLWYAWM